MTRAERIEQRLRERLAPLRLAVLDRSREHAGHAGARPQGETHYDVEIVSAAFEGISRIARQRLVHELLAAEFASGLHALAVKTLTPAEDAPR